MLEVLWAVISDINHSYTGVSGISERMNTINFFNIKLKCKIHTFKVVFVKLKDIFETSLIKLRSILFCIVRKQRLL